MTDDQAMRVLSPLVALTGGWDDPKLELWVTKLAGLTNPHWAREAVDMVIDTHTSYGSPTWARLLEAYQAVARRREPRPLALPPANASMTLDDYLAKLKLNAAGGSSEARDELGRWERLALKPRKDGSTPDWIAALR